MRGLLTVLVISVILLGACAAPSAPPVEKPAPAPSPTPPTPTQCVLLTVVDPPGGGSVSPGSGTYPSGPMVYLIATPSPGYRFVSRSGDVPADIKLSPDIWIPTDQDRTLQAHFELISTAPAPIPPTPTTGIINVNVTLNGSSWSGPVSYTITGPTQPISGTSTSSYSNLSSGSYTFTYNSGGPSGATLANITPSATQYLNTGGTISFTLNFQGAAPPALLPDLTITTGNPTVTPSIVSPGGTVSLSAWTVKNQGNANSGSFSNGFYLSGDSVITAGDTYLTGNSNSNLAPGAQFNWGGPTLTIPSGTPPGNSYIGILVDQN